MRLPLAALLALPLSAAADPFAEEIRPTPPLTPEEERRGFQVPAGFEVQLFAAEPQIAKPVNMAFDARGRLWVTETREYPLAAADRPGRDAIKVLEDRDGDGRAETITTFADGLNIPVGVLPFGDGVIAWSIPNIWFLRDTDGDGRADRREVLYGPLGWERDTHGMSASFRRGLDGWIYLTHGYQNRSTVRGRDGSALVLESGNTYRVRPDGRRVEAWASGQVNPFGLAFDPLGNLYSADSHSAPVYQLMRGGSYPTFGGGDEGLGLAPPLMQHAHGSTAIAGIAYYDDDRWPEEFRDNVFVGNVATSRVNRDRIVFRGASPVAVEQPDLMRASDPWFRPVDLQLGPDGALYIADFYNRIIAHNEVPLDHPGRDRTRGRIWRLFHAGTKGAKLAAHADPTALGSPNIARRQLATHALADAGRAGITAARRMLGADPLAHAHAAWVLHGAGALSLAELSRLARHTDPRARVHAARILAETRRWTDAHRRLALGGLGDSVPHVVKATADALGRHPSGAHIVPLVQARRRAAAADTHLTHALRIALRENLRPAGHLRALSGRRLELEDRKVVADVAVGIPTAEAAEFLAGHLRAGDEPLATRARYVAHAARYARGSRAALIAQVWGPSGATATNDLDAEVALFQAFHDGLTEGGATLAGTGRAWAADLARRALDAVPDQAWRWRADETIGAESPWSVEVITAVDDPRGTPFISSRLAGEAATGVLRSAEFSSAGRLRFFLAGSIGDEPRSQPRTVVRLRRAGDGAVLAEAAPSGRPGARAVSWQVPPATVAILEVTDAGNGWIAVGRGDPPLPPVPPLAPREASRRLTLGASLAAELKLIDLVPAIAAKLAVPGVDLTTRARLAEAAAALTASERMRAIAPLLTDPRLPVTTRHRLGDLLTDDGRDWRPALAAALASAPPASRARLAGTDQTRAAPATPSGDRERQIARRLQAHAQRKGSVVEGARLFARACAACHRLGGNGGGIGPALDGIGGRGVGRLLVDLLDPSRTVDPAFRLVTLTLRSGEVRTGVPVRERGEVTVLVDLAGREIRIPRRQIRARHESQDSPMPDNFGDLLTEQEVDDLVAFLTAAPSTGLR